MMVLALLALIQHLSITMKLVNAFHVKIIRLMMRNSSLFMMHQLRLAYLVLLLAIIPYLFT